MVSIGEIKDDATVLEGCSTKTKDTFTDVAKSWDEYEYVQSRLVMISGNSIVAADNYCENVPGCKNSNSIEKQTTDLKTCSLIDFESQQFETDKSALVEMTADMTATVEPKNTNYAATDMPVLEALVKPKDKTYAATDMPVLEALVKPKGTTYAATDMPVSEAIVEPKDKTYEATDMPVSEAIVEPKDKTDEATDMPVSEALVDPKDTKSASTDMPVSEAIVEWKSDYKELEKTTSHSIEILKIKLMKECFAENSVQTSTPPCLLQCEKSNECDTDSGYGSPERISGKAIGSDLVCITKSLARSDSSFSQSSVIEENADFISPDPTKCVALDVIKPLNTLAPKICELCNLEVRKQRGFTPYFGLLLCCMHVFCYSCIREKTNGRSPLSTKLVSCPTCGKGSPGIIPRNCWINNMHDKAALFKEYAIESKNFHNCKKQFNRF